MKDPLTSVTRRTQQYWYIDGLNEIATGAIILLTGAVFWLVSFFESSGWIGLLSILPVFVILGGAWLAGRVVRSVKERLTYPRTGYVSYPRQKGRFRILRAVLGGSVGIAIGVFIAVIGRQPSLSAWLPLISAFFVSLGILLLGYRFELTRFYVLAVYTVLAGWILSILPYTTNQSFIFLAGLLGMGFVASGCITLIQYLRTTQPPEDSGLE